MSIKIGDEGKNLCKEVNIFRHIFFIFVQLNNIENEHMRTMSEGYIEKPHVNGEKSPYSFDEHKLQYSEENDIYFFYILRYTIGNLFYLKCRSCTLLQHLHNYTLLRD